MFVPLAVYRRRVAASRASSTRETRGERFRRFTGTLGILQQCDCENDVLRPITMFLYPLQRAESSATMVLCHLLLLATLFLVRARVSRGGDDRSPVARNRLRHVLVPRGRADSF